MGDRNKNIWKRLSQLFPGDKETSAAAGELFREYESQGLLDRPHLPLMELPLEIIVDFFSRVNLMHSTESPILRRRDTRWMNEFDYTQVNIRACGAPPGQGNFLSAALYLATLRMRGVVLAPLTAGPGDNLAFLGSHTLLREELAHPQALAAGVGGEDQLDAFVEAAHLLGLVLGFDLDYRVDPQAAVVYHRPGYFLWSRRGERLNAGEDNQEILRKEVKTTAAGFKQPGGGLDYPGLKEALNKVYLRPHPSQDQSGRTPFSFYKGEEIREEAVQYWGHIFDQWRDRWKFDFLVLRGTAPVEGDLGEVPGLPVIREAVELSRKKGVCPNLGVVVEGPAFEVEDFGVQGVDLVLEDDGEAKADKKWMDRGFALDDHLHRVNLGRKLRFSVPWVIKLGERDSRPVLERANQKRFAARFLGLGPSQRPLWESMGAWEGAWGYEKTIKEPCTLGKTSDPQAAAKARWIESVAKDYKDAFLSGERLNKQVDKRTAWWVIRFRRGLLIPILSMENPDLLPPPSLTIDFGTFLKDSQDLSVLEYDFKGPRGNLTLVNGTIINVENMHYREFRLYVVT